MSKWLHDEGSVRRRLVLLCACLQIGVIAAAGIADVVLCLPLAAASCCLQLSSEYRKAEPGMFNLLFGGERLLQRCRPSTAA
jgi:hypothetical protein